jgi:hypothetical protein
MKSTGSLWCSQELATVLYSSSKSTPYYLRSILILYSYLCLDLPSAPFSSGFPTKIVYVFIISTMRAICLAYLIRFYYNILIIKIKKILTVKFSPASRHFLHLMSKYSTSSWYSVIKYQNRTCAAQSSNRQAWYVTARGNEIHCAQPHYSLHLVSAVICLQCGATMSRKMTFTEWTGTDGIPFNDLCWIWRNTARLAARPHKHFATTFCSRTPPISNITHPQRQDTFFIGFLSFLFIFFLSSSTF